eukprot:CAMPEP_0170545584 /NCGR_PEP_ID=MMETSP0211-20121228/3970_1 /TAXON_ID=311385 /ORGANISM="Pseudokeronopsis sp., Strain OXSARD2" /LENGTH=87 /DNA_ID=CAMNT_0010849581 /DNA_START=248 /DNA_END=508 /DNA_ORIENTATION=-
MAMSLVIFELSFILLAVVPLQMAIPMHFVVDPVPFVDFPVTPHVHSKATYLIIYEVSLEQRSVCELQDSFPFLLPFPELPFVLSPIW